MTPPTSSEPLRSSLLLALLRHGEVREGRPLSTRKRTSAPSANWSIAGSEGGGLVGRRVLVVEDEALISMVLEDFLSQAGAIVVGPAGSVAKALALIEAENLNCAVLDYTLRDGNSVPVAEALVARGVPLLLATGYTATVVDPTFPGVPRIDKPYAQEQLLAGLAGLL